MSDIRDDDSRDYGQTRMQELREEGMIVESDQPPEEYRQLRGEKEIDIVYTGHVYPAVVTAHFPDVESGRAALDHLRQYNIDEQESVQWFEKDPPDVRGDVNDPGLEPGEAAIILQLQDESLGEEIVRQFEQAGAKHARFYPAQQLGKVHPDKEI
jgi:hypothetical protein